MTTTGDDDRTPPPSSPAPPDPFHQPTGSRVERPRFGDGSTGQYAPDYTTESSPIDVPSGPTDRPPEPQPSPPQPSPPQPQPPTPQPDADASAPTQPTPPASSKPPKANDSRRGLIAPIAAGIVLIGGIGLLFVISGSEEPETTTGPGVTEVREPDSPLVDTTVPIRTSPPLVEPTTTSTTSGTPTTAAPVGGGPTPVQLDAALLGLEDIGPGDWTEEPPEFEDVCGTVLDELVPDARSDVLFQTLVEEPFSVRQISNTLITFPTADIAERAFDGDVDLLVACDATTIDFDGVQYRVGVENDSFDEAESAAFPCADQSAFLLIELTNATATVPYIGQSSASFRCGRNITITALTSTIGIDDLSDDDYFDAVSTSNVRMGALPGS